MAILPHYPLLYRRKARELRGSRLAPALLQRRDRKEDQLGNATLEELPQTRSNRLVVHGYLSRKRKRRHAGEEAGMVDKRALELESRPRQIRCVRCGDTGVDT